MLKSNLHLTSRRTLLRWLGAAAATTPFPALRAWAQTAGFPGKESDTLRELAAVVLPGELGRTGTDRIAARFERWVREYRPGADTEHGYGFTQVKAKGPSPARGYMKQLEQLRASFAGDKKAAVERALADASLTDLPRLPDGKHVITDLMTFYFRGSDANDLCYQADIGRDKCRTLAGSDRPPPPLQERA